MKKNAFLKRIISSVLVIAMTISFASLFGAHAVKAEPAGDEGIYSVIGETKAKTENLIKMLTDISKTPFFKDSMFAYFGPCVVALDLLLPSTKKTSLDDISKKLDDISAEIQGKITKEADRIIAAMDGIPDIIDVRSAMRNITALKKSIENAQTNMKVDFESESKTVEERLRAAAKELGIDPREWGYGSTINGVEVLAEDITVKGSDIATAVANNSLDNLYVSMYRFQCTKSLLSGEAIDKAADFVNTTFCIYLNCATTILQYLDAKAQVAVMDHDDDMLRKINLKIESFLDDMEAASDAYYEFFTLNRIVFVGNKADATQHIPLNEIIGTVNHKSSKVEDIDLVFRKSALSYDDVKNLVADAKANGFGNMKDFLLNAGFRMNFDGTPNCLIASAGYKEGGTVSVPFHCYYKGVNLNDSSFAETAVQYYQFRRDVDTYAVYDKQWTDMNAAFFERGSLDKYELVNFGADSDFENWTAILYCPETGKVVSTGNVKAMRTDDGEKGNVRTYTVTAYYEGKAYSGTQDFGVKMYQVKTVDEKTVLSLNWGSFGNNTINWASIGGKESINEIRIAKGVEFSGDCSNMFNGLVNCEKIETENVKTDLIIKVNGMFSGCKALKELDLSTFDTSRTNDFTEMFSGCDSLQSLDLSNFTVNVSSNRVERMFENCRSLTRLVLSANMSVIAEMGLTAKGDGFRGWAREDDPFTVITGKDKIAVFSGEGTYIKV